MYLPYDYSAETHSIVELPFLAFLHREFPRHSDLFTYYHRAAKCYWIAGWTNRARGRMVDILPLGPEPLLERDDVELLRFLIDPPKGQELTAGSLGTGEAQDWKAFGEAHNLKTVEMMDLKRYLYKKFGCPQDNYWSDVRFV